MAQREFRITELRRAGDGSFVDTLVQFTWTANTQSAPRPGWQFGIKLRTVREDYPGADEPVEQVLGPNYTPFTCQGWWDDRYAGVGFAERTRLAFEALVARGNLVRFEFEGISVTGLITECTFDYRRQVYIGYSFTVSPHFRVPGGLSRNEKLIAPDAINTPVTTAAELRALVNGMAEVHAGAPAIALQANLVQDVGDVVASCLGKVNELDATIQDRAITPTKQVVSTFSRIAQTAQSLKGQASRILEQTAALTSSLSLSWETAVNTLEYETWSRGMSAQARLTLLKSDRFSAEMARRSAPHAIALYRPQAGESLYGISNRFYGTPHRWRDVAERNRLDYFTLRGTELLVIPEAA